jgi:anti-anti-sigma factor
LRGRASSGKPFRCATGSRAVVITHSEILDSRAAVVEIDGPLDSRTSPDFEDYINRIIEKSIHFILFDAGGMSHVSSEGIGLLLILQKKVSEANGFFVIFNLTDEVATLYRLLGFDKVFRIAGSRSEALQILDRQRELREGGASPEEGEPAGPEPVEELTPAPAAAEVPRPAGPRGNIIECASCHTLMRVSSAGDYLCPACGTVFSVPRDDRTPDAAPPRADGTPFSPLIVECAGCRSLIRIRSGGAYRCPDCGAHFTVGGDQTVSFAS